MADVVYVPRDLNVDPLLPIGFNTVRGDVVGGDTAMQTADGDASYVELPPHIEGSSPITSFHWELSSGAPRSDPIISQVIRVTACPSPTSVIPPTGVELSYWSEARGWVLPISGAFVATGTGSGDYTTGTVPLFNLVPLSESLADGYWNVHLNQVNSDSGLRVTRLALEITYAAPAVTWLRNHQRDDGLGSNPPRNHRRSSQQGSIRNHGYR